MVALLAEGEMLQCISSSSSSRNRWERLWEEEGRQRIKEGKRRINPCVQGDGKCAVLSSLEYYHYKEIG